MIHRLTVTWGFSEVVVNCFQITTLVDDSQEAAYFSVDGFGCELLSDYYFSR